MSREHEQNEQESCASCGSPSHTGSHTPDCPANNQTDERLSFEEAQKEAQTIRESAFDKKDYIKGVYTRDQKTRAKSTESLTHEQYDEGEKLAREWGKIRSKRESDKTYETKNNTLDLAKQRAMEYVEQGDLKSAIDSIVSDLSKDKNRPEMQKSMIAMMGMELRSNPNLTKEKVIEFIKGFNG